MDIDQHILRTLASQPPQGRPMTIGDIARQLGVSPVLVLSAARRLVDGGLATPSTVDVRGVQTLRGLLPLPVSERPV